ncbi:hypothetical protein SASPL_110857 [Salvia splendens]|uniref:NERD domain-containing protein n=1 Tax=Salvia splendens TaxID=180675 RepID=A0A8X8Y5E2_SALSN|nr:hypothetical protein SASPL_110857 [Salvia splendens]
MKLKPLLLILLFLALTSSSSSAPLPNDAAALLHFKSKADLRNQLNFSPKSNSAFCKWKGVECSDSRAVRLIVEDVQLGGVFAPNSLSQLAELRLLNLQNNSLTGPIPDLSGLVNLKALFLNRNYFSGAVPPSLSALHRLKTVDLSYNMLAGSIPASLNGLDRLYYLRLDFNRLNGSVPPLNQSSLQIFNVSHNDLTGAIPVTPALSRFNSRLKLFLYEDDTLLDLSSSHFSALFTVAKRLEKLYHGSKVYIGLQIPDTDSASRQNIDLVLVTQEGAMVITVKNISGFVSTDKDGNWVCTDGKHHKTEVISNPVPETKRLIPILEEYLEQRGVSLPEGYFSAKVICPNPKFSSIDSDSFPAEVITYDQWKILKPGQRSLYSGWIKGVFGGKDKTQHSFYDQLNSALSTAPISDRCATMLLYLLLLDIVVKLNGKCIVEHVFEDYVELIHVSCYILSNTLIFYSVFMYGAMFKITSRAWAYLRRLELKGNKYVLGEFIEFKGKEEDLHSLRKIKRSKISQLSVQKISMFGLAHSTVQVLFAPRDYRADGSSKASSHWEEVTVRSSTEVVFQPLNSTKPHKYKLSSVISMSLSA